MFNAVAICESSALYSEIAMSQDIFFEEDEIEMELIDAWNCEENSKTTRSRVRKQSLTWSLALTNKLITEVEKNVNLWNHTIADYKNRVLRHSSWTDVCLALDLEPKECVSEVRNKWSSVRANFRVSQFSIYFDQSNIIIYSHLYL